MQGPEWPNPHDCTNSIWDELKFIPIIESNAGIEVGSICFSFTYFKATHKKNYIQLPKHFKPQLPTCAPPKTLNLVATQEQK